MTEQNDATPVSEAGGEFTGWAVKDGRLNADWVAMVLSEDARIEDGKLANAPYLAVKIATAADQIASPDAASCAPCMWDQDKPCTCGGAACEQVDFGQALAKPASSPAGGGVHAVREALLGYVLKPGQYEMASAFARGQNRVAVDMLGVLDEASLSPAATPVSEAGGEPDMWSPKLEAIRLLKAEDTRQLQILELLETIREQVRLGVKPEHRPDDLMKNLQTAVYGLRGRMPLLNDAAIMALLQALAKPASSPAGGDES